MKSRSLRFTNQSGQRKAVRVLAGHETLAAGETRVIENAIVPDEELAAHYASHGIALKTAGKSKADTDANADASDGGQTDGNSGDEPPGEGAA